MLHVLQANFAPADNSGRSWGGADAEMRTRSRARKVGAHKANVHRPNHANTTTSGHHKIRVTMADTAAMLIPAYSRSLPPNGVIYDVYWFE